MGLRAPVPSMVGRDGLPARSWLGGRPVTCPSVLPPHVFPCVGSDQGAVRLLTGSVCQAASPGCSRLELMEQCQRGHDDGVRGG